MGVESAVASLPREPGAAARTLGGESVRGGLEGEDRGYLSPPSVVRTGILGVSTPAGTLLSDDVERRLPLDEHAPESLRRGRGRFYVPSDEDLFEDPIDLRSASPQGLVKTLVALKTWDVETPHRTGAARAGGRPREGDTKTTLHLCQPTAQPELCYGTAQRGGQRLVCIAENCAFSHKPDRRPDLRRGYYIKSPSGAESPTMFPSCYVLEEEFRQSPALQEAVAAPMELSALVRLVQAVQGGEASEDARREQARFARSAIKPARARIDLLNPKRRKVGRTTLEDSPDGSVVPEGSDDEEGGVVDRVHLLEGSLGERGPGTAAPTAWAAIRGLEEAFDVLDQRQVRAKNDVASLESIAAPKSYVKDTVRAGMSDVARPLLERFKRLEERSRAAQGSAGGATYAEETRRVLQGVRGGLKDTRKHLADLIRSRDPATAVGLKTLVTRLENKLSAVEQEVGGGMVEVGPYKFRSQAEVAAFIEKYFPSGVGVYDCFLSVSGIIQRVGPGVSDVATLQADETHEYKVKRNERKTKVITSFQGAYPSILGKTTPFSELKSVLNWANHEKGGFSDRLKKTIRNERREFEGYLRIVFKSHPDAHDFCHKLFEHACGWKTSFLAHFLTYYEDLVRQASPGKGSSVAIRKQC